MKINLPIYYEVDKKEQIVVAKFKDSYFDCLEYMHLHSSTNAFAYPKHSNSYLELSDLKGVAKCFKGDAALGKSADKYDVEFGKKLARTRLMRNFYRRLRLFFFEMEKILHAVTLECSNFRQKAFQKKYNCDKHLERLIEKTKQ